MEHIPITQTCRVPPANNLDIRTAASMDFLRYDAIAEIADAAVGFASSIADAAELGQRLKAVVYVGLIAKAATTLLKLTAELGHEQVQA